MLGTSTDDKCKHCGACRSCDFCACCGKCRACGKQKPIDFTPTQQVPVFIPYTPPPMPVYPQPSPWWVDPFNPWGGTICTVGGAGVVPLTLTDGTIVQ